MILLMSILQQSKQQNNQGSESLREKKKSDRQESLKKDYVGRNSASRKEDKKYAGHKKKGSGSDSCLCV